METALQTWYEAGPFVALATGGTGLAILLYYIVRLSSQKEKKDKYDFIIRHEIDKLWYSALALIVAAAIYANTVAIEAEPLWLFVRVFVSVMFAIILGVIVQNLLKFYYPFFIESRLKKLRYTPRVNPNNGNLMKLLGEDEEDVHLEPGMQAEEDLHSIDYDVWLDAATGYTRIEKYDGHLHALQCPECNYQTFKVKREELVLAPTTTTEGELVKHYCCAYCDHKSRKAFRVARLEQEVAPTLVTNPQHRIAGA
ncbi:hypothetical protein D770_11720 [Flammeovirgaceae bacterium 311]|nr:hypothetical protein D770_11720 [Flammeovirgaceae bacterium 311]